MAPPRLLFDEQLAARLVTLLAAEYPGSAHVRDLGLLSTPDVEIWEAAAAQGYVLVSKDEDYQRLAVWRGPPPKVVWIRLGNCSTQDIATLLRTEREAVARFTAHPEASILALGIG